MGNDGIWILCRSLTVKKNKSTKKFPAHKALSFFPCFSYTMSTKGIETCLCMIALDNSDPFIYG